MRRGPIVILMAIIVVAALVQTEAKRPPPPPPPPDPTPPPPPPPANGTVRIHYVNVGQGDGTIWELPGGTLLVYDCGPSASSSATNKMAKYLREHLDTQAGATLHALVASHGHLDHIGGCQELFGDYGFTHVYETWYTRNDAPTSYKNFKTDVQNEGATIHTLGSVSGLDGEVPFARWDLLDLPQATKDAGVQVEILWPATPQVTSWDRIAEKSIVLRLTFGSVDFCFQGDIETSQENSLADETRDLSCEVYLVGHHGSRYASSTNWVNEMSPDWSVVSFGNNGYGHPTSEALCRVQTAGSQVYATHRLGNITIETNGTNVTVTPDTPETQDYCAEGASYW